MTRRTLPALAALILGAGSALATQPTTGTTFRTLEPELETLQEFRWSSRPVIIFAPSPDDPQFKQALAALRLAEAGLVDREIVVLTDTAPANNAALREKLAPQGFAMLLIGKDGGVKLRSDEVILPEELFATIDRMPMRQREMQQE